MDREEIKNILPHRNSMLLVDEASVDGTKGSGSYTIKGSEFFLDGHYPDNPVVPGVILCEIAAQICGVTLAKILEGKDVVPYFSSLDNVRIRRPVRPGDKYTVSYKLLTEKPPFFFFDVVGSVDGQRAISGKFGFAIMPK